MSATQAAAEAPSAMPGGMRERDQVGLHRREVDPATVSDVRRDRPGRVIHVGDLGVGRRLSRLVREGHGVGRGHRGLGPDLLIDYIRAAELAHRVPWWQRLARQPREET